MKSLGFRIYGLRLLCFIVLSSLLNSCTNNENQSTNTLSYNASPKSQEVLMQENLEMVKLTEDKVKAHKDLVISDAVGLSLISVYINYIRNFPNDKKNNPDFLYKAAEVSMNLKQGNNAIRYIEELKTNYPDAKQVPYAEFMKGFVYQNVLNDKEKARTTFKGFITKYPKNELVTSAKQILESIDMTEADFLKKIKKGK